jgi:hypothetical protein
MAASEGKINFSSKPLLQNMCAQKCIPRRRLFPQKQYRATFKTFVKSQFKYHVVIKVAENDIFLTSRDAQRCPSLNFTRIPPVLPLPLSPQVVSILHRSPLVKRLPIAYVPPGCFNIASVPPGRTLTHRICPASLFQYYICPPGRMLTHRICPARSIQYCICPPWSDAYPSHMSRQIV